MSTHRQTLKRAKKYASRANRWQWHQLRRRMWASGRFRTSIVLPRCFDEKFLWRKVFDHDPRFTIACDKLATKAYLASRWADIPVAKTLWVGHRGRDLPSELIRKDVVLKYNAGSGTNLSLTGAEQQGDLVPLLDHWMRTDYGWAKGEWGYGGVRRRILAEEQVFGGAPVSEIKVYVQGGFVDQIVMIYMDQGRKTAAIWESDDRGQLNLAPRQAAVSPLRDTRDLPQVVEKAVEYSRRIGREVDHVRLDFMTDLTDLTFGEFTIYNLSGRMAAVGMDNHARANLHWDLRRSWFMNQPHMDWKKDYCDLLRDHCAAIAQNSPIARDVPAIDPDVFDLRYDDFAPE